MEFEEMLKALKGRVIRLNALLGGEISGGEGMLLPVITVEGVCRVEVSVDGAGVLARMKKEDALAFDFSGVDGVDFEAYGMKSMFEDLCAVGESVDDMKTKIARSRETEIGFTFYPGDSDEAVVRLVNMLRESAFYI